MNIEPSVNFLVGAILVSVSVFLVAMFMLLLNNIFSKYWKPVRLVMYSQADYPYRQEPVSEEKPKAE
jgi:hypothetical protein